MLGRWLATSLCFIALVAGAPPPCAVAQTAAEPLSDPPSEATDGAETDPTAAEAAPQEAADGGGVDDEAPTPFQPPETTIDYDVEIVGAPDETIEDIVRRSLRVTRQQEDGAQSLAFLRSRAAGDVDTVRRILRSFGYYSGDARMLVLSPERRARREARRAAREGGEQGTQDAAAPTQAAPDAPETSKPPLTLVRVRLRPGPAYRLERHDVVFVDAETVGAPTLGPARAYGSPVDDVAAAAPILDAEGAMVAELRRQARPYARSDGRRALADRDAATLEIDSLIMAGPAYVFGPITFEGAPDVEEAYLRTYAPWQEGEPVDASLLRDYQRALMGTELFGAGRVELPDAPPVGEVAPVSVVLEQAPFRTFSTELFFNSDEGPGGKVGYEHRNVFGANEKLELRGDTTIGRQIALARLSVPQYLRSGQLGVLQAELRNIEDDAFDERGGTLTAGLERRLSDRWRVGLGVLAEHSVINDTGLDDAVANLIGVPAFVAYDGSNSLLDPTDGARLRVTLSPFAGEYQDDPITFGVLDAAGSVYRGLDAEDRLVAAGRLRLGSILAGSNLDIPPTRRFYSGGGGSVRGYQKDFIGPIDRLNSPVGGSSVVEINAELRARVWGDVSVVGFVDAGSVASSAVPTFEEGVQVAVGLGGRYASPIGPIRLDVAVPLEPRRVDNAFEFYVSIGQAF
ncbi:MAG: BamA/TamA family outer membrane protein [Pseudomonadota bacterium]